MTKYIFSADDVIEVFDAQTDEEAREYAYKNFDLYNLDGFSLINISTDEEVEFDYL